MRFAVFVGHALVGPSRHTQALSSGQVEHDLDGARLGGAGRAVEGGRHVLGGEAKAVRDQGHDVHLLAGHEVQAERVLQGKQDASDTHKAADGRMLGCRLGLVAINKSAGMKIPSICMCRAAGREQSIPCWRI